MKNKFPFCKIGSIVEKLSLSIIDNLGREIYFKEIIQGSTNEKINVSNFGSGIDYYLFRNKAGTILDKGKLAIQK